MSSLPFHTLLMSLTLAVYTSQPSVHNRRPTALYPWLCSPVRPQSRIGSKTSAYMQVSISLVEPSLVTGDCVSPPDATAAQFVQLELLGRHDQIFHSHLLAKSMAKPEPQIIQANISCQSRASDLIHLLICVRQTVSRVSISARP